MNNQQVVHRLQSTSDLKHCLTVLVFGVLAGWMSPTDQKDSADLLALVVHAIARGVHRQKEAALAAAGAASRSPMPEGGL